MPLKGPIEGEGVASMPSAAAARAMHGATGTPGRAFPPGEGRVWRGKRRSGSTFWEAGDGEAARIDRAPMQKGRMSEPGKARAADRRERGAMSEGERRKAVFPGPRLPAAGSGGSFTRSTIPTRLPAAGHGSGDATTRQGAHRKRGGRQKASKPLAGRRVVHAGKEGKPHPMPGRRAGRSLTVAAGAVKRSLTSPQRDGRDRRGADANTPTPPGETGPGAAGRGGKGNQHGQATPPPPVFQYGGREVARGSKPKQTELTASGRGA